MPSAARILLLLTLALALSGPASSEEIGGACADRLWYDVRPPAGWASEFTDGLLGAGWRYTDPERGKASPTLTIIPSSGDSGERRGSPRDQLSAYMSLAAMGGMSDTRPSELRHPTLPSAATELAGPDGSVTLAVVHGLAGESFLLSYSVRGEPTPADRELFRATLASLRSDPAVHCELVGNRMVAVRGALADAPAAVPEAAPEFSWGRALGGCSMLARLFVPVFCLRAEVDGREAGLVSFYGDEPNYGGTPQQEFFDRHAKRVTVIWCEEASQVKSSPPLYFALDDEGEVREWSCPADRWAKPRRAKVVTEFDAD